MQSIVNAGGSFLFLVALSGTAQLTNGTPQFRCVVFQTSREGAPRRQAGLGWLVRHHLLDPFAIFVSDSFFRLTTDKVEAAC